jgi:ribosomal protein L16 Arg81 hydroxylase
MTCALWPGDWLYVPLGWGHAARARRESLSISLGVRPGRPPRR